MNDLLGNRMKSYEGAEAQRRCLPMIPLLARIDGRCFSRFTRSLERPYDRRMSNLMTATAEYVAKQTGASMAYTQSDEISLVWYTDNPKSQLPFGGRFQKLTSILAAMTTSYFTTVLPNYLPNSYSQKLPHFDARCWSVPTLQEAANTFLWREIDATKNSIQMAAQHYYSHDEVCGKHGGLLQEMLFQRGVNWNDYPAFFKRGVFIQKRRVKRPFTAAEISVLPPRHAARTNPDLKIERLDFVRLDMPPFGKVTNRVDVIFNGADPQA